MLPSTTSTWALTRGTCRQPRSDLRDATANNASKRCLSRGDHSSAARPISSVVRAIFDTRSEEHTSELQSQSNLVCRLLLEKKKNNNSYQSDCPSNIVQLSRNTSMI